MDYYSAIRKKILPFAATWMKVDDITVNEKSHNEEDKFCTISLTYGIQGKGGLIETE